MTDWQYVQYVIISGLAGVVALYVGWYASLRRKAHGGAFFALFMLAVAIWALANTAEFLSQSIPAKLQWANVTFIGIVSTAPLWLLFAIRYAHPESPWTRRRGFVFWIVPLAIQILVMTNHLHGLVWSEVTVLQTKPFLLIRYEYAIVLWIATVYFYILLMIGTVVLVRAILQSSRIFRMQVLVLLVAVLLPWLGNVLFITGLVSWADQDLTPIAFSLTGVLMALGLFRYQILDTLPVARSLVIEGMNDGMIMLDDHGRIVDINPAAATMLGRPQRDVVGRPAEEVLGNWSELVERFRDLRETQEEILIDRSQWFDLHISTLLDRNNRSNGRLIVLRDISDRKHVEAELRRYTSELEAGNAELDAFAHTVAHDLRSPLSTINGFADILRTNFEHRPTVEIREYLDYISDAGHKMQGIIEALLLLASLRRSEEVPIESLDMAAIVHEVEKRLAPQVAERHTTLHAMDQWPLVSGVRAWVEMVWINYVTNALKYGGDNTEGLMPRVEMGWDYVPSQASAERRHVRFWVKDNGRGLTVEQRARLFTPFTRLHLDEPDGHGLGLTIVERIISRLDGDVGAESAIGEGSLFWFTLSELNPTAKQED